MVAGLNHTTQSCYLYSAQSDWFWLLIVIGLVNLSANEPHRQIGVDRVVTLGSLGGVTVSTLAQNARDVSSIPAVGAIFPIAMTPITAV